MKKIYIIITSCLVLTLVLIGYVYVSVSTVKHQFDSLSGQGSYELQGDKVPSVSGLIGKRNIVTYDANESEKVAQKTYSYGNAESSNKDVKTYFAVLEAEYGFVSVADYDFTQPSGSAVLAAHSKDDGKIIRITLTWDSGSYTVKLEKGSGEIETDLPEEGEKV